MTDEKMPEWDLSEYYNGTDDKKIDEDIKKYAKLTAEFAQKYKGKLASLTPKSFVNALKELEDIERLSSKLGGFAYLNSTTRLMDTKASALYQKVVEALSDAGANLLFFGLEYNKMDEDSIRKLEENKEVQVYAPYLKRVRKFKPYELSEEVEKTLLEKDVTSGSAWVRLYEESMARLSYEVDGKKYNDAQIGRLCLSADPELRGKAGKEINRVSKDNSFNVCYIYNMIMKDKAVEDKKRGFKFPMSSRNLSEEVSDETVNALAQTVRDNYKNIAWRFYKLKAKLLGVDKINYWDRNAPLPIEDDKSC